LQNVLRNFEIARVRNLHYFDPSLTLTLTLTRT